MDISAFGYDTEAYENGLPVSDIPGFGDIVLIVRGQLSDRAMAARSRISRAMPENSRTPDGQLTEDAALELNTRVILESCLIGWENITDGGKPLDYSLEAAEMLLANKRFRIGAVAYAISEAEKLISGSTEASIKN